MKKGGSGMGRSIAYLLMALLALAVGAYTLVSVMLGSNGLFVGNFLKISNRLWYVILFMLCLLSGMLLLLFAVGRGEKKRIGRLCKAAARAIDTLMHTRNERKAR